MKHIRKVVVLYCLLFATHPLAAQPEERKIFGVVKDAQTLQPVPSAHVVGTRTGTYSDQRGWFVLSVEATDTLCFSHINYRAYNVVASTLTQDSLFVLLQPKDFLLREVTVRGLPDEEKFKRQILQTQFSLTQEEVAARENFSYARKLFLSGYVPTMNSRDNYDWHAREPSGVTLFSSGPNQGLLRAGKNIFRYKNLLTPLRINQPFRLPNTIGPRAKPPAEIPARDAVRE